MELRHQYAYPQTGPDLHAKFYIKMSLSAGLKVGIVAPPNIRHEKNKKNNFFAHPKEHSDRFINVLSEAHPNN